MYPRKMYVAIRRYLCHKGISCMIYPECLVVNVLHHKKSPVSSVSRPRCITITIVHHGIDRQRKPGELEQQSPGQRLGSREKSSWLRFDESLWELATAPRDMTLINLTPETGEISGGKYKYSSFRNPPKDRIHWYFLLLSSTGDKRSF